MPERFPDPAAIRNVGSPRKVGMRPSQSLNVSGGSLEKSGEMPQPAEMYQQNRREHESQTENQQGELSTGHQSRR